MSRSATRVAFLTAIFAAGCSPPVPPNDGVPRVVVTIFPVADLLAELAGSALEVHALLPPRAAPSSWEATPAQIRAASGAVGFVSVGGGLDGWLEAPGMVEGDPLRLRLSDHVGFRDAGHDHGEGTTGNPHVWLDPILVRDEILPVLERFVAELSPMDAAAVSRRAEALADSLDALDRFIRAELSGARMDTFIATHDAWAYFSTRYGLHSVGSLYERPGHEPSARGLAGLMEAARASGLEAVLTEPQLARTAARALADELALEVVVVDPLGGPGLEGRERYLDMMRFNARGFARALGGS